MQSYKKVPEWWFYILLAGSVAMSLLMSFVWKESVQLPWWGMLFAFALAFIVTLPIGVIQATTNQVISSLYKIWPPPITHAYIFVYLEICSNQGMI